MATNNPHSDDDRVAIVRKIIWLSRRHFQIHSTALEESGLGSGQVPVLLTLNRRGPMNQKELAELIWVTPATMSGTLKRMEKNGFITRTPDEKDARVSLVQLTDEGRAQCQLAKESFELTCYKILEGLDDESCTRLKALIDQVGNHLRDTKYCPEEPGRKE